MTKNELIAALKASKASPDAEVFVWDIGNAARYQIIEVDNGGCLDLNCNPDHPDYAPEDE